MPILRATLDLIAAASFIAFCFVLSLALGA
jgi:hypothetical protein